MSFRLRNMTWQLVTHPEGGRVNAELLIRADIFPMEQLALTVVCDVGTSARPVSCGTRSPRNRRMTEKICRPYPDNAGYKTIGYVPPCVVCKSSNCWDAYLAWEKKAGITRDPTERPPDKSDA